LFIIPDFCLIFRNCSLTGVGVGGIGAKEEVEVGVEGLVDGFEAASAELLEVAGGGGAEADVLDEVAGAAVLDDEFGLAFYGEGTDLADVGGVVDDAFGDGFVEEERFIDELCGGDDHSFSVGRCGGRVNAGSRE
jgi:hypothetical protein